MDIALSNLTSGITNVKTRLTGDTRNLVVSYNNITTQEFSANGGEMPIGGDITAQLLESSYVIKPTDGTDIAMFYGKLTKPANWSVVKFNVENGKLSINVSGANPFDSDSGGTMEMSLGDDGCLYGDLSKFNDFMTSVWGVYKWDDVNLALKYGKIIQTK